MTVIRLYLSLLTIAFFLAVVMRFWYRSFGGDGYDECSVVANTRYERRADRN